MRCPICGNLRNSGRCPHDLMDSIRVNNKIDRVRNDHANGRIDIGQALERVGDIQKNYRIFGS